MAEYKRPQSEQEFDQNFKQKKPLMNQTEAYMESSRCLFCYDAPCVQACPTHIDIPLFIKQIHTGNAEGAARTIYDMNWMGNACGKVCPTQVLCEGACVFNHQHVKPIEIGRLQNYATNKVMEAGKSLFHSGSPKGKKVAIIGAGPAGISCACELSVLGYSVTIFEAKDKPSGLTVYGTAPYKITNEEALTEMEYLQKQLSFKINYSSPVSNADDLQKLEAEFDAIFLGVGNGPTAALHLPGEDFENVIGAVEFVETLRIQKHRVQVPDRIVVIGGGNTAMDAASESARMGASQVYLAYRRSKEQMGAYWFEYDLAVSAGVKSIFNASPLEILGKDKATGVRFIKTTQENGRIKEVPGSEFVLECDLVIKATGQAKMAEFLTQIKGLELDKSNRILVHPETFQTGNPKYFAGGDAVNGGAEVVNGAFEGKQAARGIHQYLLPHSSYDSKS
ncbi:MAG: NAD(P)-dependent oxidoreductase [Lewinellaceae bacterium]|nr:NAD(P)-dependent oxidoreductase [Saprospiraceae bacterium]MCB9330334.1 NAD(P)-dependent oxidoreductase [Lewinellaceae bacterium]